MPKITPDQKKQLQAKHPGAQLEVIKHPKYDDECLARPPSRAEWRMYRAQQATPSEGQTANEFLIDACVLFPEKDEREKLFDRRPALVDVWAVEINEMAGNTARSTREKL